MIRRLIVNEAVEIDPNKGTNLLGFGDSFRPKVLSLSRPTVFLYLLICDSFRNNEMLLAAGERSSAAVSDIRHPATRSLFSRRKPYDSSYSQASPSASGLGSPTVRKT